MQAGYIFILKIQFSAIQIIKKGRLYNSIFLIKHNTDYITIQKKNSYPCHVIENRLPVILIFGYKSTFKFIIMYVLELLSYRFFFNSLEEIIEFFQLGKYKSLVFDKDIEFFYGCIFRIYNAKRGITKQFSYQYHYYL